MKADFGKHSNNFNKLINCQLNLNLFQNGYQYITFLLPAIILSPRILSGELEIGSFVKAGTAFRAILIALTLIIQQFEQFTNFAAGIDRLDDLERSIDEHKNLDSQKVKISFHEDSSLAINNLTLYTPNYQTTLVENLSLTVSARESLLIVGESGVGKSSIVRAIAGLWKSGQGGVTTPNEQDILFLPQKPYMTIGSLRQQLLYPEPNQEFSDEHLLEVLKQVNLQLVGDKIESLDTHKDWSKVLSLGEQQRLAFARLLLRKPTYGILDEATSSLDVENEELLYQKLEENSIAFVSVAHRSTLRKYHQKILEIQKDHSWSLKENN